MIAIIDYGAGNLKSVENAAIFLGKKVKVTDSIDTIKKAKKIVLPGVGNFKEAVCELKKKRIFSILKKMIKKGSVPFLGICVGMQLLLDESEEAPGFRGLGLIKGKVKKFRKKDLVIPHMGWNQVMFRSSKANTGQSILKGIKSGSSFYFAHSYYCCPENKEVVLTKTNYGFDFASALKQDNIWAVQFHPEKSQELGLRFFKNFLNL